VIAALATVLGGKPWLAVDVILLGCVPLAGASAFLAIRRVTRSTPVRVWAAASYALAPVAMGAIAAGRIGTAVVFVLIPVIARLAGRMLTLSPRRARRAAWATGLVVALAAAFVPLVWVVVVAAALALVAARPVMWRNLGIAVAVPPVLLLPWTVQVAANPSALLLEVGLQQPGLAVRNLPARSLLLLSPGGPGLPPIWVTAGIVFAALAALLLSRRRALMMAGWGVALSGLLAAVAVSRVVVTPASGEPAVSAWPGAALLIAAVGLLLAGATAGDAIPRMVPRAGGQGIDGKPASGGANKGIRNARKGGERTGRSGPRPMRRIGVVVLVGVACSAPALAAAYWVISGVRGPVGPVSGPIVPAVVTASSGNGLQQRTLVLRSAGSQVSFSLLRGASPSLGDPDLAPVPAAQRALSTAVAALVAPNGGEALNQARLLAQFDIGFVLLPAPVDQDLARVLNGVSGLRPVSSTSAFALWSVTGLPARVRVAEPDGRVVAVGSGQLGVSGAQVPAAGGTIELAEPAGGWTATLNGQPLAAVASPAGSWAQAFRLPPGGGVLDISHNQTGRDLILVLEFLAVAAVAVLALPGSKATVDESAPAAAAPRSRGRSRGRASPGAAGAGLAGATVGTEDAARPSERAERTTRGRAAARGGRPGRGRRRDGETAPGPRRGRRAAAERRGAEPAGRRSAAAGISPERDPAGPDWSAGGPPGPRTPWPTDEPADPGAGWPADEDAGSGWPADEEARSGWPEDEHAGWPAGEPAGPGAGWPSAEPAGWPANERGGWDEPAGGLPPVAAQRSPSGTWPPPDQTEQWGPQPGWPAPDPSGWSTERSDVLDPLPPGHGSRHRRPDPDDDEGPAGRPVPERDWGGDAW
jgi:hypothetical protein